MLAPFFNIRPTDLLLLPVHVVLLELIIDPTCSIVLERQPAESNIMNRKPRNPKESILTKGTLIKGILQGFIIFAFSFSTYFNALQQNPDNSALARTMGLSIVMIANIFLVMVNSSNQESIFCSINKLIKDKIFWAVIFGTFAMLLLILYTPLSGILSLTALSAKQMFMVIGIAAISVLWYEVIKLIKRRK